MWLNNLSREHITLLSTDLKLVFMTAVYGNYFRAEGDVTLEGNVELSVYHCRWDIQPSPVWGYGHIDVYVPLTQWVWSAKCSLRNCVLHVGLVNIVPHNTLAVLLSTRFISSWEDITLWLLNADLAEMKSSIHVI